MEDISPQEVEEIQRIVYQFFLKEYGSEQKAQIMLRKLANFVQDPGVRLNTLWQHGVYDDFGGA
jgi:hypothetical protein